jgi:hypothetical protein
MNEAKVDRYDVVICGYSHCGQTWWDVSNCECTSNCPTCNAEIAASVVEWNSAAVPVQN